MDYGRRFQFSGAFAGQAAGQACEGEGRSVHAAEAQKAALSMAEMLGF